MANHQAKCPECGAALLVSVLPHQGGSVEENVNVALDPNPPLASEVTPAPALEAETPAEETAEEPVEEPTPEPPVNPSPVAVTPSA